MTKPNISGNKQREIKSVFDGIVSDKLATLDGEAGDRLIGKLDLLRAQVEPTIINAINEFSRLVLPKLKLLKNSIELGPVKSHDPNAFFQTREGLWVSDQFKRLVLSSAKPVKNLGTMSLSSYELTENMYDTAIKEELPKSHVFKDSSELCARIEQLISKQPNGEEGDLINNGYANLLYQPGCVVSVIRDVDYRKWDVVAWELDDYRWNAGHRAFSGNRT